MKKNNIHIANNFYADGIVKDESHFQDIISLNSDTLFKNYFFSIWGKQIFYMYPPDSTYQIPGTIERNYSSKADFVLIEKDLKEWIVVEVETVEDDKGHVQKQAQIFNNGYYGDPDHENSLFNNFKKFGITKNQVYELINGPRPKILFIFDKYHEEFKNIVTGEGSDYMILNPLKPSRGENWGLKEEIIPMYLRDIQQFDLRRESSVIGDNRPIKLFLDENSKYLDSDFIKIYPDSKTKNFLISEETEIKLSNKTNSKYIEIKNMPFAHRLNFCLIKNLNDQESFKLETRSYE